MQLNHLLDTLDLEREIAAGYIQRRFHPDFPTLAIIGYTDRAQFDNHWTPTTRAARGIIYDTATSKVIARPFAKFFNHGQGEAQYDPDAPLVGVFDKQDGSLGIRYTRPDGVDAIATRGSFDSEQARHATQLLHADGAFRPNMSTSASEATHLYEIIYPGNRIVVDYGTRDELIYLGTVVVESGEFIPNAELQEVSGASTLREVLELPPRPNAEGWVVWIDATTAVKIKQEDYLALHRIVSSLNTKEIWRQLRAGTYLDFARALPDEFHGWAQEARAAIEDAFQTLALEADGWHERLIERGFPDRRAQALWLLRESPSHIRPLVFLLLDGRDPADAIWKQIEPHGEPTAATLAA